MENSNLIPFEGKEIRKVWHEEQWYFSIVDVMEVLTDSPLPRQYWNKVKKTLIEESESYPFWIQLKLMSKDGKGYKTDCTHAEGVLRIAMSVPSPKAEPLKLWLAQVGVERIQETENPELGFERMTAIYRAKGYTEDWIDKRIENIKTRNKLTDEWKNRDIKEGSEYSLLTAIIAKGTFGLTPTEHKNIKGLSKTSQNLRDHMTPLELIFTSLGEELTREEAVNEDAQGFVENKTAAIKGGSMAGEARKTIETQRGKKVVSAENFLKPLKGAETNSLPESSSD